MSTDWGIIGHDYLGQMRDRRDLGLAKAIRFANEHSVPGLAGLSFLRSIVWALIGVDFAEKRAGAERPLSASVIAEGVEALACWHAIPVGVNQAMRIRGARKLPRISEDQLTLKRLARGRGYVSQPVRVGIGAALPGLGLVEARNSRFNSFTLSDRGKEFLKLTLQSRKTEDALPLLWNWLDGGPWPHGEMQKRKRNREIAHLSPVDPLPSATRAFFSELMESAGEGSDLATRRSLWRVSREVLSKGPALEGDAMVAEVIGQMREANSATADRLIWSEKVFNLYAATFEVLDQIQPLISNAPLKKVNIYDLSRQSEVKDALSELNGLAKALHKLPKPDGVPQDLGVFLESVVGKRADDVLRELVARDGLILRLEEDGGVPEVVLHPDFIPGVRPKQKTDAEDEPEFKPTELYRLRNLCVLCREVMQES
ncbi:hypothetical protein EI545_05410 [Tabrizicola piscis]|uniref:Uncharacterized protein n=1 Tax=Tabrizicola piscis TaxID=2494374 RepID=A0A3S8U436_9RHOB|nr:hypothetical protein [Tabrizicola piscis]AZL58325.1 hypothetical protein EI545_05410 [Tabrizicola piscis]